MVRMLRTHFVLLIHCLYDMMDFPTLSIYLKANKQSLVQTWKIETTHSFTYINDTMRSVCTYRPMQIIRTSQNAETVYFLRKDTKHRRKKIVYWRLRNPRDIPYQKSLQTGMDSWAWGTSAKLAIRVTSMSCQLSWEVGRHSGFDFDFFLSIF